MVAADKLREQMRANPRDGSIEDVSRACEAAGVARSPPRGGSHYKVKHPAMREILTIPARRPVKPVHVCAWVSVLDRVEELA